MKRSLFATFVAIACLFAASTARAHLMPDEHGTLHVVGDAVFVVLSVPVSPLHGFDDDGDGVLSSAELARHRDALDGEIAARFSLFDGDVRGTNRRLDLVLSPSHEGDRDRADHVIALAHVVFPSAPTALRVTTDLFGARGGEGALTLTASRGGGDGRRVAEVAVLTPRSPAHVFFPAAVRSGAGGLFFVFTLLAGASVTGLFGTKPRLPA